jgi:hypothetical protein
MTFRSHKSSTTVRYTQSDEVIQLTGPKTKKLYPKPLRKVKYYDQEYHRTYECITNNFELTAQEEAEIYKRRRQEELFFKWIKQNLRIKTFWGTRMNAVFGQLWAAHIISVLLWTSKTLEGIAASAHKLLQMMKTTFLAKSSILELCAAKPPPPKIASAQLLLEGLYD